MSEQAGNHEQKDGQENVPSVTPEPARCVAILEKGIKKSSEMKHAMSALMSDLATGRMTAGNGNAICNAAGKMLKVVELEQKYGTKSGDGADKQLTLSDVS